MRGGWISDSRAPSRLISFSFFYPVGSARRSTKPPGSTKGRQTTTGRAASPADPGESAFLFQTVRRDHRGVQAALLERPRTALGEEKVSRRSEPGEGWETFMAGRWMAPGDRRRRERMSRP
jgi:hypothetical protein